MSDTYTYTMFESDGERDRCVSRCVGRPFNDHTSCTHPRCIYLIQLNAVCAPPPWPTSPTWRSHGTRANSFKVIRTPIFPPIIAAFEALERASPSARATLDYSRHRTSIRRGLKRLYVAVKLTFIHFQIFHKDWRFYLVQYERLQSPLKHRLSCFDCHFIYFLLPDIQN